MCETLEALCSVLPRRVPGSCENRVGNQQGLTSSGSTVSYALCEEEEGKRGWPSVQEPLKFSAEYLPELNGEISHLFRIYWKCPSKQLYPTLLYIQNKDDNFVFCLLIMLNETHKCWQDKIEYHVLNVQ